MPAPVHLKYIRLQSDDDFPLLDESRPFKAILIAEEEVSQPWQWEFARWIVGTNCRCVMAWGVECVSWEEAIEDAHLEAFNYEDVPQDQIVVTSSHEDEDLSEVFWFARHRARHPVHELTDTLILHLSADIKKAEFESEYADA